jgi:hypothetical protein
MSRRQHVVRTDDQGGLATPRAFGGCEIFCATQSAGISPELASSTGSAAEITVASSRDYQRCFVSATIDGVFVTIPDPPPVPGPGSWTVRFECPITVTDHWHSNPYYPPGMNATLNEVRWAHTGPEDTSAGFDYAWLQKEDDYYPYYKIRGTSGTEVLDPGEVLATGASLYLGVQWKYGPMWVELSFSSQTGEFVEDVTISGGTGG